MSTKEGTLPPVTVPLQEGSLQFASVHDKPTDEDLAVHSVGTARTEWLPELLRKSLPWMYDGGLEVAKVRHKDLLQRRRKGRLGTILKENGVEAIYGTYASAAAQLTAYYDRKVAEQMAGPTVLRSKRKWKIRHTLTQVGLGKPPFHSNTGVMNPKSDVSGDIETGPAALVALNKEVPTVYLYLDRESWLSNRRRLRNEALLVFAELASGYDVRLVASEQVESRIRTQHPQWCDWYLTQNGPAANQQPPVDGQSNTPSVTSELWDTLGEIPPGKRLELLDAIPANRSERRSIKSLKSDPAVGISSGTIDRYYRELEEYGLISVVEPADSNEVYLTPDGQATSNLLTDDYDIQHPTQTDLTSTPSHPPQSDTRQVCKRDTPQGVPSGQSFEEALQDGQPTPGDIEPQELPLSDCHLDESAQFTRLAAMQLANGVTLIDAPIGPLNDGRGTYFGENNGEAHLVLQWGGALPTLVRSAVTLLSDTAFDETLTKSNLAELLSGPNALDEVRRRLQIGWISTTTYTTFRDELQDQARSLLRDLPAATNGNSSGWSQTARKAHGLLTAATALFSEVGIDLTVHIRVPDTSQLVREDSRYREFLQFLQSTVPKNYQYNGHSASRLLLEQSSDKLKYRFPDVVESDNRVAQSAVDWVIVGPHTTDFQDDIVSKLSQTPIRDQVAEGSERGIQIPIEVRSTENASALTDIIESVMTRVNREFSAEFGVKSCFRTLLYAFCHPQEDRLAAPTDIAEVLLAADRLCADHESIGIQQLVQALGFAHPSRVYPWLAPSARAIVCALLRAEAPLQRQDIVAGASISDSSYDRHRSKLDEYGLLVEEGKHQYESAVPGEWEYTDTPQTDVLTHTAPEQLSVIRRVRDALQTRSQTPSAPTTVLLN